MSVSSRDLVDLVLLGPTSDRRQLQDSPVLGDVWVAFATKPAESMDLLITPTREKAAGPVAVLIADRIRQVKTRGEELPAAQVAYLQGLVAARLSFRQLLRVVVPMTKWWQDRKVQDRIGAYTKRELLAPVIRAMIAWAHAKNEDARAKCAEKFAEFTALDRYVALAGIILWAGAGAKNARASRAGIGDAMAKVKGPDAIVKTLREVFLQIQRDLQSEEARKWSGEPQIWLVNLNRRAMPAVAKSVPAVKGDAARTLFSVKCDAIRWAVMDSGIDGSHPMFRDENGESRVIKAYDFSNIRKIVSLDNRDIKTDDFKGRLKELLKGRKIENAAERLQKLAEDAENDRPIHWDLVEDFIEVDPNTLDGERGRHGTHVAGILGARRDTEAVSDSSDGMCPDIKLYDFRVLSKTLQDTEFAIIAALQFIRYLNDRHTYISVHGANLSLSIPHDVRNFACGRTPICNECERLVESGVVVVAAAGNLGYQRFETADGSYEGYTAFSISDPGNADGVITVGATHRYRAHTYGVSFFSSRGPTGDGRMKPDLVAPGERIESCLPDKGWGELDGTSMAAPHVSGAAAMLLARYTELIGEPRRIKRILCESATDLGRERSFQGNGMLDVLRAFQRI
ncbi:MAG TPA: S8 family peptidase [Blastocatellia bacterium]|nr:S8 family peptidase [Blastocatellia bacterium]